MQQQLLDRLAAIVGPTHVLTGDGLESYEQDWRKRARGKALAVVRPGSTQEVADVVKACSDARVSIVPQGGNTGLVVGSVPDESGTQVTLSLRRLTAVRAADPGLSHRYYRLKAKWFGVEALPYWDRNAPLPKVEQRTIPWAQARDTVLDAYGALSPEMAGIAKKFFDDGWTDAPTRPRQAPGALAHPTAPPAPPHRPAH